MKLSHLADTLIGSEIVKLGNAISERVRNGEKIYNFTIGDFDPSIFPIPEPLEAAIIDAYQHHYTNYPPADGILELRQAVSSFLQQREGLSYNPSEILIASGGRPLIYTIFKTIVDKGDKVIYAAPSWNNNHYVHMLEGEHCVIDTTPENNFMPLAADIEPHLTGATLLCLCSPQNPTGTTLLKEELEQICALVLQENQRRGDDQKKLYVLYDQMYWTLTFSDTRHYNPVSLNPAMKDYTLFVDGISKVFAATGVRVGWSLGPAVIINKMKAILSHVGAWAPMAEQKATAKFLGLQREVDAYLAHFKAEINERLTRIFEGFVALRNEGFAVDAITPQAAMYLTIKLDLAGMHWTDGTLATQDDVTSYLLSEAKLAIVPFYAFGADKSSPWYRLSVGTCRKEEIDAMLSQLRAALARLSR